MSANYDLTPTMAPYLDAHLMLPLLDALRDFDFYNKDEVTREKFAVVSRTNMTEAAVDLLSEAKAQDGDAEKKSALEERGKKILAELDAESADVAKVRKFFADAATVTEIKQGNNMTLEYLANNHDISPEALNKFFLRAKFEYECGQYAQAEIMLNQYLSVSQPPSGLWLGALWGRLACHMLTSKWEETTADFQQIKDIIDNKNIPPVDQIRQRGWLLHWSLFVHTNRPDGVDQLADLFAERPYSTTMENLCPWMLRYYTAAVILSPSRRRNMLKDVLREIQEFSYLYSDPITQFLESLYKEFDFDVAQVKLAECQELIKQDFFLKNFLEKFTHEARVLICEMYCTINKRVDLKLLATKLQLTEEEAEKWMVNMIRGSAAGNGIPLDAKIDSSEKQVLMSMPFKSSQQYVVEKTRDLTHRSSVLSATLETVMNEQKNYLNVR
jgi:translation initiation factor 3 subunit E